MHQTKRVHEHLVSKNKYELVKFVFVLSINVFSIIHAHHIGTSNGIHGLEYHFTPAIQATSPAPLTQCFRESKAQKYHFQRDYYFSVWVLNIRSLACWQSLYSFLPLKLSELLSCIRNPRKTRIHSRSQICDSSPQCEKGEVRNNEHRGIFIEARTH